MVDNWLRTRIAARNPELGRPGDVCPFVGGALVNGTVTYALVAGADLTALNVAAVVGSLGTSFDRVRRESHRPDLETVIVLFPDMAEAILKEIVLEVHRTLKDSFVRAHRMLGEFLPGYESPGVHNPRFRPLASPVPLLVIRSMVGNDAIFLRDSEDWLREHRRLRMGELKEGA
ncbi:hypothetical protein GCM10023321_08060 [Pseudonocardia eucalypti]|uniref:DUF6875 domain-containing protein n=1 Tax=Pseudonocardia eucalypti TaxID=648755 RepID=A0ABP9PIS5_9PSEU|nr:hypothetical protein [Pseudonocardia eucalypti]